MVKEHVQELASMGRTIRLSTLLAAAWDRILKTLGPRCPFRLGDAVQGDDPFNGRHEGIVMSRSGSSVEIGTAAGVFYYDHRQLKLLD
jgi:hypothetical protein